jgi:Carboxypeptidase regulatory-like domain
VKGWPAALAIGLMLIAGETAAQGPTSMVAGVVRDSTGRPLAQAVVALDPGGDIRATRADSAGRFRFTRVRRGAHELRTTWIGYRPEDRFIDVSEAVVQIEIVLVPLPYQLDTLEIRARRSGIEGTVLAHARFRPIADAEAEALGTRYKKRTGADGRFDLPELGEGAYAIEARHDGYKTRVISAAVAREGATEVAITLDTLTTKAEKIAEHLMRDMESRIHWRSMANSAIVGRQELAAKRDQSLETALRYAPSVLVKGLMTGTLNVCNIVVDGRPDIIRRVGDFRADAVSMVEVYGVRVCSGRSMGGMPVIVDHPGRPGVNVFIWLKH